MKIFIDAHNTISAGTTMVTANFLSGILQAAGEDRIVVLVPDIPPFAKYRLRSSGNITVRFAPQFRGPLQILMRLLYQVVLLPFLLLRFRPDAIFVFGNYLLMPWRNKTVFLQTPYIVDDHLVRTSPFTIRVEERIVRALFRLTSRSARTVVVQNDHMKQLLISSCGTLSANVTVLPTPISSSLAVRARTGPRVQPVGEKLVLFVSRYYRHKNHDLVVRIAERYHDVLLSRSIRFLVTVDPDVSPDARAFIESIARKRLERVVGNLGEIDHDALMPYYERACALFFPSRAESFGLPLVEAMAFGLPVVVPDLGYAHAVCGSAGVYFTTDDVDDAARQLLRLSDDAAYWEHCSKSSRERFATFPSVDAWTRDLVSIIRGQ